MSFTVGHRYLQHNSLIQDSSLLTLTTHIRFNDNWAISATGNYEAKDRILQYQSFQLHRDLTSWIASIGFTAQDNGTATTAQKSYGVTLSFTLKDLPSVRLPVSVNPGLGGTTSGTSSGTSSSSFFH
jgi:hypothetical protein